MDEFDDLEPTTIESMMDDDSADYDPDDLPDLNTPHYD